MARRGAGASGEGGGRIGLQAVADKAGVGIATVGRVLNERGNVSPATARRVLEAARELGLRRVLPPPHRRLLRLEVVLARPHPSFLSRLNQGFASLAATLDRSVLVQRTSLGQAAPAQVALHVRRARADGLIVFAEEHAAIRAAIAAATAAGTPVVCMVTDIRGSGRLAYVGIDHARAGRTAGLLAARMLRRPGPVLVLTGDLGLRAHAERLAGFRAGLAEELPDVAIAAVLEGKDEDDRAARLLRTALRAHPDAAALYNSGGCLAAVAEAIRRQSLPPGFVHIGHELTEETRALLREGVMTLTIDQAFELQARRAVELLLHRLGHSDLPPGPAEIPFTLHTRANA